MAQFDVYRNTNPSTLDLYPYLLNIQNTLFSSLKTRLVVPLGAGMSPVRHLNPLFEVEGRNVMMCTAEMAGIPLSSCGEVVANLSDKRNDILDAMDFLVNGF